jgi:hypothetical protein
MCSSSSFSCHELFNTPKTSRDQPESTPPEIPEEPELVIPESPIGLLGLISALVAAFGLFAVMKNRA